MQPPEIDVCSTSNFGHSQPGVRFSLDFVRLGLNSGPFRDLAELPVLTHNGSQPRTLESPFVAKSRHSILRL